MSDDETPEQIEARRRRQAQGAAADLRRMGIDPGSLGLDDVAPASPPAPSPGQVSPADQPDARVVQLRPGQTTGPFTQPSSPPAMLPPPPPGSVAMSDAATRRAPTPGETFLRHTEGAPGVARSSPAARRLGDVVRGLATPDAAEVEQRQRQVVDAIRSRQVERRIVAFVSGKGGVGCTTVAVGVGTVLAALREDDTVVMDLHQGAPPITELFGADAQRDVLAIADLDVPIPTSPAGLGCVDGVEWDLDLSRGDLAAALNRLTADYTFSLLDLGTAAGEAAHAALARADQVVVVSGPGTLGQRAMREAVDRVHEVNPLAAATLVPVVVCAHPDALKAAEQAAERAPEARGVALVPSEQVLAAGEPFDPARVGAAHRESLMRVAAAVALGATGRRA